MLAVAFAYVDFRFELMVRGRSGIVTQVIQNIMVEWVVFRLVRRTWYGTASRRDRIFVYNTSIVSIKIITTFCNCEKTIT